MLGKKIKLVYYVDNKNDEITVNFNIESDKIKVICYSK